MLPGTMLFSEWYQETLSDSAKWSSLPMSLKKVSRVNRLNPKLTTCLRGYSWRMIWPLREISTSRQSTDNRDYHLLLTGLSSINSEIMFYKKLLLLSMITNSEQEFLKELNSCPENSQGPSMESKSFKNYRRHIPRYSTTTLPALLLNNSSNRCTPRNS